MTQSVTCTIGGILRDEASFSAESNVCSFAWCLGSVSSSDVGGMYSSSYGSDYLSRGPDVCF